MFDRKQDFSASNKIFDVLCPIHKGMNLSQAIAAIRALDLPEQRRVYLIHELKSAPTTGRWSTIVQQARQEAVQARLSKRAAVGEAWRERRAAEARKTSQSPVEALPVLHRPVSSFPAPRPVTVTWTKPTKPDAVRQVKRPEVIDSAPRLPRTTKPGIATCPPEHPHNAKCYSNHKCRCTRCRVAKATAQREYMARRRARQSEQSSD